MSLLHIRVRAGVEGQVFGPMHEEHDQRHLHWSRHSQHATPSCWLQLIVTVFMEPSYVLCPNLAGAAADMAMSCMESSKRGGPHKRNSESTSPAAGQHAGSGARRRRAPGPPARGACWRRATARTARPPPPGWRRSRRSRPRWPAGSTGTGPRPPPALQRGRVTGTWQAAGCRTPIPGSSWPAECPSTVQSFRTQCC